MAVNKHIGVIRGGDLLPEIITCRGCGNILYEDNDLVPPDEIIRKHNGVCPKCGRKLEFSADQIEIRKHVKGKKLKFWKKT